MFSVRTEDAAAVRRKTAAADTRRGRSAAVSAPVLYERARLVGKAAAEYHDEIHQRSYAEHADRQQPKYPRTRLADIEAVYPQYPEEKAQQQRGKPGFDRYRCRLFNKNTPLSVSLHIYYIKNLRIVSICCFSSGIFFP